MITMIENEKIDELESPLNTDRVSLEFALWMERIHGKGEDAEPIVDHKDNSGLIAVFDGMGGSGSEEYHHIEKKVSHTSAYFASRTIRDFVKEFLDKELNTSKAEINSELISRLESDLSTHLKEQLNKYEVSTSRIISRIKRKLPSTMVAIHYMYKNSEIECNIFWSGDSRAYILKPSMLHLVSKDDVKDILENDTDSGLDAPLSNFISADSDFKINHKYIKESTPVILLVVSDGCYAYMQTPIHFDLMLIETLSNSEIFGDWESLIEKHLKEIAGDDCSMALACIGWENFESVKSSFKERLTVLRNISEPINKINSKIDDLQPKSTMTSDNEHFCEENRNEVESLKTEKKQTEQEQLSSYQRYYQSLTNAS